MDTAASQSTGTGVTTVGRRRDARLEPAFRLLDGGSVGVLSLDIFDTLIWRKVPEPVDAFPLVAERLRERDALAVHVAPGAFKKLRIAAEQRARARLYGAGRGVEVSLQAVYEEIPPPIFCGRAVDEVARIELEVERDLIVPDLDVVELVRFAHERGKAVVGVSDTYLSEEEIRFLLADTLSLVAVDRIFTSSQHGKGKGSGLFRVVLSSLRKQPHELLHIGDNEDADVRSPARLGIRTIYFERRPDELREIIAREGPPELDSRHGDFGLSALRSKVLHRSDLEELPEALQPYWRFGAVSLGPACTAFAEWVHERAQARGAKKVFCLMREGELLARLVNNAAGPLGSGVVAEPLWLSRRVCVRAAILEGSREEVTRLLLRRQMPTVCELCATLGVDVDESPVLARHAAARLNDARVRDAVLDELTSNARVRERVVANAATLRDRVVRYLRERLEPNGEAVLVDIGWAATIQAYAQRILRAAGVDVELVGLYLLTQERIVDRLLDGVQAEAFLAHVGVPDAAVQTIIRSPEILEQACMPPYGSQIGFDAALRPILADATDLAAQQRQVEAVQRGMIAFQREWSRYRSEVPAQIAPLADGAQPLLLASIVRAVAAPTRGEAETLGTWLHDENYGSHENEGVTAGRAAAMARHLDPAGLISLPMTELYWPFGTAALADAELGASTAAVATGAIPWEAFGSPLETGLFHIYMGRAWGYSADASVQVLPRRNRLGLSYVRGMLAGDGITSIRLDPVRVRALIRFDRLVVRCWRRGGADAVEIVLADDGDFAALCPLHAHALAPRVYHLEGKHSSLSLELAPLLGLRGSTADVYQVEVECAFAALPLGDAGVEPHAIFQPLPEPSSYDEISARRDRLKRAVLHAQAASGLPLVPLLLRLRWQLRRLAQRVRRR